MTVRHVVMLRRRADVAEQLAQETDLTARLTGLGAEVPGIEHWSFAANEHDRPLCWDYLLEAELADAAALSAYLAHPAAPGPAPRAPCVLRPRGRGLRPQEGR